jgi:signal transduction histidine kinase
VRRLNLIGLRPETNRVKGEVGRLWRTIGLKRLANARQPHCAGEACILGIGGRRDYFSSKRCLSHAHRHDCEPVVAVGHLAATESPPRRWIKLLAWGIAGFAYLVIGFAVALAVMNGPALRNPDLAGAFVQAAVPSIAIALVGGLVASRQPRNPIGWLLLAGAGTTAVQGLAGQYAVHTLVADRGSLPGVEWVAWLGSTVGGLVYPGIVVLILLLFPNGRLPSARWRLVMWIDIALAIVNNALGLLDPAPIASPGVPSVPNPLLLAHIDGLEMGPVGYAVFLGGLIVVLAAAISLVIRLRRTSGAEREQVRWVAYALGTTVLISITYTLVGLAVPAVQNNVVGNVIVTAGFGLGLPAAIGVAMLRYHLYDIDIVISRTLVYGTLAVLITAVYVGIAVGIGTLVGSGGKPNLGLSILATAIVAVGFQPARERLQRVANRLVYGKRATPYQVLSEFSGRVAEAYTAEDVLPRMAGVLRHGTGAELATVWVRAGGRLRQAAASPEPSQSAEPVELNGSSSPDIPGADRSVLVRHQGEVLGALTITKRRGESITPIEVKLMDDLAHQAGLVLKNVGLSADLHARLVDLRASRQRLVAAQDDERRRLERNLHDGAQQHLVAIKVKLGIAEMLATRDPEKARAAVAELKHDADEALETLRDLARGIYPPLLADRGLPTALQAQARKATLPVTIEADGIGRYPQDTEAALYFCILEALQNIQKYAEASSAMVRIREQGAQLCVEVADDGRGFDVSTTTRGNGLNNMEDRLDALGGTLEIASSPGNGTTLRAVIPVLNAVPAQE